MKLIPCYPWINRYFYQPLRSDRWCLPSPFEALWWGKGQLWLHRYQVAGAKLEEVHLGFRANVYPSSEWHLTARGNDLLGIDQLPDDCQWFIRDWWGRLETKQYRVIGLERGVLPAVNEVLVAEDPHGTLIAGPLQPAANWGSWAAGLLDRAGQPRAEGCLSGNLLYFLRQVVQDSQVVMNDIMAVGLRRDFGLEQVRQMHKRRMYQRLAERLIERAYETRTHWVEL